MTGFEVGQRIFGDYVMSGGGSAEYACVPANLSAPVPEPIADETAAACHKPAESPSRGWKPSQR
nr:hypothetical protein [Cohaesibacter sp. ES.047]